MSAPLFLFAPGAGAPSSSPWMQGWKDRLSSLGEVVTLDYPYTLAGRRSPDKLPTLIEAHRQALQNARAGHDGPVVLAGKSMGARVGCHVATKEKVDGLVCLGYPLKAAGKNATVRDAVLKELRTPILFVQGTRDPLCPLDLLEAVRRQMTATNELIIVETGNHSLQATKTHLKETARTQDDVDSRVLKGISAFIARL